VASNNFARPWLRIDPRCLVTMPQPPTPASLQRVAKLCQVGATLCQHMVPAVSVCASCIPAG
jgi:hypothetical protein